ncbi:MAG: hypothetical protein ABFD97_12820 [Syntrophobacter sp.]
MAKVKIEGQSIEMRRCTRCQAEKPATAEHFSRSKTGKHGLCSICKECRKIERAERNSSTKQDDDRQLKAMFREIEGILYVAIDFQDHPELMDALSEACRKELRPVPHQILWCIRQALAA